MEEWNSGKGVLIKAVYASAPVAEKIGTVTTDEAAREVWGGKIESKPLEVKFYYYPMGSQRAEQAEDANAEDPAK